MEISHSRDMDIIGLSGWAITIKIFSILVFAYPLLLYATPVCAQKDFSALYKKVAPSVARIDVLDREGKLKSGTGFFIREDGVLVTNYHVIEGSIKKEVKLSNGEIIPIERIIAENRGTDLVLLKLRAKGRSFSTLKVTDKKIKAGQPVVMMGGPFGLEGTISDGIISEIREIPDVGKIFEITAPISPSSSGSPVLNIEGEVVGVATALLKDGQSLNFAIPVESLMTLMLAQGSGIEDRLTAVEKDIVDLKEKMASIEKDFETSLQPIRRSQADLEVQMDKLQEDVQNLLGRFEENKYFAQATFAETKTIKEGFQAKFDELDKRIEAFNKIVEDLGKKVEDAGDKAENWKKTAEGWGEKVEDLGKKAEDWEKTVEDWEKTVEDWEKKVEDVGKKAEDWEKTVEDFRKKIDHGEKEIKEIRNLLKRIQHSNRH